MEKQLNALVYDHLNAVSPKAAMIFKKEMKPKGMDEGTPRLKEIVNSINQAKQLNSLVYAYLCEVLLKAAKIFRKDVKPKDLEEGTPSLKETVAYFNQRKQKRKKENGAETNGPSTKKMKINSCSDEISRDVVGTCSNEGKEEVNA